MNILFFLTPKAMCAYIESDDTLRQAMERMEHSGYAALPVLDKSGKYCGVVTEGDLLWTLKRLCVMDLRQTEEHSISEIEHRRTVQPVRVDTRVCGMRPMSSSRHRRIPSPPTAVMTPECPTESSSSVINRIPFSITF